MIKRLNVGGKEHVYDADKTVLTVIRQVKFQNVFPYDGNLTLIWCLKMKCGYKISQECLLVLSYSIVTWTNKILLLILILILKSIEPRTFKMPVSDLFCKL